MSRRGDVDEWRAWSRAAPESQLPLFSQAGWSEADEVALMVCLLCGMRGHHDTHEHLELEACGEIKLTRSGWVEVHHDDEE